MNVIENYADIAADTQAGNSSFLYDEIITYTQPMTSRPKVSVIIPTLNEAKNLPLVLPYLPMNWVDEVVLVDGCSTDNTVEVARRLLPTIKIVVETKKGKGAAMRAGYHASCGDILIVLDADGSNDPREIPRYVTALLEGADFVKGSRFAPGGGTTDMPRYRMLGNGVFVLLGNILFCVKFTDLCYGYHAFWRYCLDSIQIESFQGFEIDTALYLQAANAHLRIVEVPSFEGYRFYGVGKLQTFPDGFRVLKTIFRLWTKAIGKSKDALPMGFRGIKYARPAVFEKSEPIRTDVGISHRLLKFMELLCEVVFTGQDAYDHMQEFLRLSLEAVGATGGSLILLDENGNVGEGCLKSERKLQTHDKPTWSDVLAHGLAGWAIKNHKPVLVSDTSEDPLWLNREWEVEHRSAIALPLLAGGMVIGALTLIHSWPQQFTQEDLELLQRYTERL